jgi:hypothetical protein
MRTKLTVILLLVFSFFGLMKAQIHVEGLQRGTKNVFTRVEAPIIYIPWVNSSIAVIICIR